MAGESYKDREVGWGRAQVALPAVSRKAKAGDHLANIHCIKPPIPCVLMRPCYIRIHTRTLREVRPAKETSSRTKRDRDRDRERERERERAHYWVRHLISEAATGPSGCPTAVEAGREAQAYSDRAQRWVRIHARTPLAAPF